MHGQMKAFLERVDQCDDFSSLFQAVQEVRSLFQVNHAVYHSVNHDGEPFALATYDADWAKYYEKERLYTIDPVVTEAFRRFYPYDWKSLRWEKKTARKFLMESIDGGVGNQGISVPIRGPNGEFALFTVSHKCEDAVWARFLATHMSELLLVGHFLHQQARKIFHRNADPFYASLSPRESDTLQLLSVGLNRSRVAERLKISEHTLRVYIESARFKLGATNTTHAVAKAISQGLISN